MRATPCQPSNRPGGTRTPNPRFWRPVLCQLSYGPLTCNACHLLGLYHASPSLRQSFSGQGRNRTTDTTIFSRVLYQLSYLARKKIRPAFRRRAARRGVRAPGLLEAPLDGPPSRARPRIRHRPSAGLLCIGPEHRLSLDPEWMNIQTPPEGGVFQSSGGRI